MTLLRFAAASSGGIPLAIIAFRNPLFSSRMTSWRAPKVSTSSVIFPSISSMARRLAPSAAPVASRATSSCFDPMLRPFDLIRACRPVIVSWGVSICPSPLRGLLPDTVEATEGVFQVSNAIIENSIFSCGISIARRAMSGSTHDEIRKYFNQIVGPKAIGFKLKEALPVLREATRLAENRLKKIWSGHCLVTADEYRTLQEAALARRGAGAGSRTRTG